MANTGCEDCDGREIELFHNLANEEPTLFLLESTELFSEYCNEQLADCGRAPRQGTHRFVVEVSLPFLQRSEELNQWLNAVVLARVTRSRAPIALLSMGPAWSAGSLGSGIIIGHAFPFCLKCLRSEDPLTSALLKPMGFVLSASSSVAILTATKRVDKSSYAIWSSKGALAMRLAAVAVLTRPFES